MKRDVYLALLSFLVVFLSSCNRDQNLKYYKLQGFAQGSTYSISYSWGNGVYSMDSAITGLLEQFNMSLSNYDTSSIISRINRHDTTVVVDEWFRRFYSTSDSVCQRSGGGFDVTVAPIVNFWGFGYANSHSIDTSALDSLRGLVGMGKVRLNGDVVELPEGMSLISNAIAQGLSVDVVAEFLDSLGVGNYLVEIGGELRSKGLSNKAAQWKIGIDKPVDTLTERELQVAVSLDNQSLATSGNYRKYYERDGVKYSHTIDPLTGYPVRHSLLSATVIAKDCAFADAYATACMVKGEEWAKALAESDPTVDVLLISSDEDGDLDIYASEGFPEFEEF